MWSDGHWTAQQAALENRMAALGEAFGRKLAQAYEAAQGEVQAMLRDFYGRYAEDGVMTLAQARRMEADGRTRQQALQRKIERQVDALHREYESGLRDVLGRIYELGRQHQAQALRQGAENPQPAGETQRTTAQQAVEQPWAADGRTFDERIGQGARRLKAVLAREVEQGLLRGDDAEQIAQKVANEMGIAQSAAKRLVRTECSALASKASLDAYKEHGVEKYKFVATMDAGTCAVCGGLDGQVFLVEDFEVGVNAPPMHPNDRCTTAPYFGELKGQDGDGMIGEDKTKADLDSLQQKMLESPSAKRWGISKDGTNQGIRHFADYWKENPARIKSLAKRLGVETTDFSNSLKGFQNFTEQAMNVKKNGILREVNGKQTYYVDGFGNVKKGVAVIIRDGKLQSMMPSDWKSFNKIK